MEKINFEDGQLVKGSHVIINGVEYQVIDAVYQGDTPLSAFVLNKLQDNIETHKYQVSLTETVPQNTDYILPCSYVVGNDGLEIFVEGVLLVKDENYKEVRRNRKGKQQNTIFRLGCITRLYTYHKSTRTSRR